MQQLLHFYFFVILSYEDNKENDEDFADIYSTVKVCDATKAKSV